MLSVIVGLPQDSLDSDLPPVIIKIRDAFANLV